MSTGHKVTYSKYGRTLTSVLYGVVTEERIAAAKSELAHRMEQLFAPEPTPTRGRETGRCGGASHGSASEWEDWNDWQNDLPDDDVDFEGEDD